ncbi:MAG: TIR domain-containing protein [Acidobacteriaceae bacterium]
MSQTLSSPFGWVPLPAPVKRHVFISSFHADQHEVDSFIFRWGTLESVFTPKALCTFYNDDLINSNNPEYVMGEIRRRYLLDSSVTILLIGKCTHSRRYVDWELKSSLRCGENVPNGLLAFVLPSAIPPTHGPFGPLEWGQRAWPQLPERLAANWNFNDQNNCYARYFVMPTSAEELRQHIEAAVWNRMGRAHLIKNDATMMKYNAKCGVCGVTH